MIKRIEIIGLFGERDVVLNLENKVKIIVGENGTGKSHILNIVYYLISNQLLELMKIDFIEIKISSNDNYFELRREELMRVYDNKEFERGALGFLKRELSKSEFEELLIAIRLKKDIKSLSFIEERLKLNPRIRMAIRDIQELLKRKEINLFDLLLSENVDKLKKYLLKTYGQYQKDSILYLPTYRRIEKGLKYLVKNNNLIEEFELEDTNSLINFGMKDTQDLIDKLLSDIKNSFLKAYATLSENMLNELLIALDDDFIPKQITDLNIELVELVLQRVSGKIDESDKERVLSIVKRNEATKHNYPILSMINNLIKLYEGSTKKLEDRIEKFVEVSNKYLINKAFFYDKKNVTLPIINQFSNNNITIDQLSSGEKQVVSLFAKIYLNEINDFMIFFDEPELSLSIEWQRMLLNDILKTESCSFMFVTTHSPFIFEPLNLLRCTVDIDDFTTINLSREY
ncbi:MAG: AAA family ATPase [Aliarcobacter skirrowii]|uniref:AAA family ATPase n=1 Tax=Aliarcobacter skirrowii TaxID=28200 RepID=UPI002431A17F|nr:AAA family ATPase [Aliarcobacter skirrowii]MDD2509052.1 AAA family ATPase [Aliarcobacter skirrowii]MDD3497034.1 AAA family ATPase [Aliarcobacter skirrowii]